MRLPLVSSALCLGVALATGTAAASTDAKWTAFARAVEDACVALVDFPGAVTVEVNPFGSATYGAALVTVVSEGMGTDRMVCIYHKATGVAELTAPF